MGDFEQEFQAHFNSMAGMTTIANGAAEFYKALRANGLSEDVSALITGTYVGILFHQFMDDHGKANNA